MSSDDPLMNYPAMLTTEQVGEVLQVSPRTLFNWRQAGGGPPYVALGEGRGAAVRYPRADLRAYLNSRTVHPGVPS